MFNKSTMTDDECSPWPPVLWLTPEVQSGIQAATDLAFGRVPSWNSSRVPAHDFPQAEDEGDDFIIE